MKIALIVHGRKRILTIRLATAYKHTLEKHELCATGTTGVRMMEVTGLPVYCFRSGPLGGGQQVSIMISENNTDLAIFLRDPLSAQPHESDVTALIRLSDVYKIPLAANIGSAGTSLGGIEAGFAGLRGITYEGDHRLLAF